MVAAKLANLDNGQRASPIGEGAVTQQAAADLLNVGKRSVERARDVIANAPAEVMQAVERGAMSVSLAAKVVDLPYEYKAMVAAKLETLAQGRPGKDANLHVSVSRSDAAEMLSVSPRSVASAP